jgi:hypothetical protein
MEEIYYFYDWVSHMLESSNYSEFQLLDYKDYYENLLNYEQNLRNYEYFQNQHDRI